MNSLNIILCICCSYITGSIPFGYLIGRFRGVNLFEVGSGNIGATNVWRVLGKEFGILVFLLDFAKGAVPVLLTLGYFSEPSTGGKEVAILAAIATFLGHLFPIFLKFRGGKGVATGAGTVLVLMPWPTVMAFLTWITVVLSLRYVSLASMAAVLVLTFAQIVRLLFSPDSSVLLAVFTIVGTGLVIIKHRSNIKRLLAGKENQSMVSTTGQAVVRAIHVVALGFAFGSAIFFNLLAAPTMNRSFQEAIANAPNDRTAHLPITENLSEEQKKSLGSALFGTAVGPLFPIFFNGQLCTALLILITAMSWRSVGKIHRIRFILATIGFLLVGANYFLSDYVSQIRLLRFSTDVAIATKAKADFASWHLISLLVSMIHILVLMGLMPLAAFLPDRNPSSNPKLYEVGQKSIDHGGVSPEGNLSAISPSKNSNSNVPSGNVDLSAPIRY